MSSPTNTLAPSSASQLDNALASDVPMVDVRDLPSDLPPNDQPAVPSTAMSPTATPASSSIETNNTSIGAAHPLPHDSHQENRQSKPSVILSPSHQPILNWQSSGDSPVPGSDNVSKHRHGTACWSEYRSYGGITEDPLLIGSTHDPGATTTYK